MSPKHFLSGEFLHWRRTIVSQCDPFLRHQLNQHLFPIRFLKVIPIQSWGPSFNFSIWFLSLLGDERPDIVEEAIAWQKQHREKETICSCSECVCHLGSSNTFYPSRLWCVWWWSLPCQGTAEEHQVLREDLRLEPRRQSKFCWSLSLTGLSMIMTFQAQIWPWPWREHCSF